MNYADVALNSFEQVGARQQPLLQHNNTANRRQRFADQHVCVYVGSPLSVNPPHKTVCVRVWLNKQTV